MSEPEDHEYRHTTEPVCPHCGHQFRDLWEWPDSDDDAECGSCGGHFRYETEAVRYFTLTKRAPAKETP